MLDDDESITLAQIETSMIASQIPNDEERFSDYGHCKHAVNVMLELGEEELIKIEENIRKKILKNGESFMQKYDEMRAANEKVKVEYEQHFIELESTYIDTQSKLETELKNSYLNQSKSTEHEEKIANLSKQNKLLTDDKETLISNQQRLNTVNQNLEVEKRELHNRLNKLITDNDRLNQEWKSMNTKLSETESKIMETTIKLEEAQSRESTISFREKQFQMDKQRLMNEIQWLNDELQKKSTQILQNKSDNNKKCYEFEAKQDELTAENKKFKSLVENLQTANENMENQVEDLTQKLQEIREKFAMNKIDFEEESNSREKLIELYKEENSKLKSNLDEAATVILDLKQIVADVKDEYSKLFDEKKMNETAFEAKFKENGETIAKLEQELKNANELLSIAKRKGAAVLSEADIQQLSPAAAVASRLLKNGMTLTQIYSEYVNLSETLENEKNENQRLKTYITEIIKDIEEKAPILKRQRQEYEEAVQTIAKITTQLENSMMDYEVLKSKSEDSIKKYNLVSSENIRLRQDVNDLSRQVTVLLHEVEKLKSRLIHSKNESFKEDLNRSELHESKIDADGSTETISKDLLLFRNIEELQKQNQKLVRLVHEITDKKQSEEKLELETKTREYNEKLMLALKELEEFRAQREKHEQVLEEIRKQRDTYKQLLNQQSQSSQPMMTFCTSTPGAKLAKPQMESQESSAENSLSNITNKQEYASQLASTTAALQKFQKEFDTYKQEMLSTNKLLNEDIDKYRSDNSSLSMKLALSESKLESSLEKCKTLNTAIDKCRRELETVKERNSKFNDIIIKHEQSINLTTQELNKLNEKVCEYENKLHSLKFERDTHKANHERLVKEHDLLIQENSSRSSIMSSLDMIKNSFDRNERETQLVFKQKIDHLERENKIQQKQLEQDQEKHDVLIKSWQSQYDQLVQQREKENADHEKVRASFDETTTQLEALREKHTEVESKLRSTELMVQMSRNTKSSSAISRLTHLEEESKDLQMKMSLADKEIVSLKIQLEESRGHAKQYKTIGDTMEKALKESSETNEKTKEVFEKKIAELTDSLEKLNVELNEMTAVKQTLEETLNTERANFEESSQSSLVEKNQLTQDLESVKKNLENTQNILVERTKNRDENIAKITILEEQLCQIQVKLTETENELRDIQTREAEAQRLASTNSTQLEQERKLKDELNESHIQTENLMKDDMEKLRLENEKLNGQINLLQAELSKLGQDLIILQKQDTFKSLTSQSSVSMKTDEANVSVTEHSSSNLLEINRYLRTQKDQAEEKFENLKLTTEINQQRLKTLENDLNFYKQQSQAYEADIAHLQASLESSKSLANVNSNAAAQFTTTQSDNFNLMMDTNKRLKEDIDQLNLENNKIRAEMVTLEEELSNVKASLSEAEMKNASFKAENNCMKVELKRWKDRVDSLLSSSDHSDEWSKIKLETQEAQSKAQELTDMINELRKSSTDSGIKLEQVKSELEAFRKQTALDKMKSSQEFDALRTDKNKREEMFKILVANLKEVVTTVQKELQLKGVDWVAMRGPINEKIKFIKVELAQLDSSICEKVKNDKEELQAKSKQVLDLTEELSGSNSKFGEIESKLKEKEIRIGQMVNFINSNKTRLNTQKQKIEDLTKELNDLKSNPQTSISQQPTQDAADTVPKADMDNMKSKLLQSKFEMERLRKELEASNALNDAQKKTPTTCSVTTSPSLPQPQKNQLSSTNATAIVTSPLNPTSATTGSTEAQVQSTPTAYIAPSLTRITKVNPQLQQQQQQQQPQTMSLRRTAAVHPTPHETAQQTTAPTTTTTTSISLNRQQVVVPINLDRDVNQWQSPIQPNVQQSSEPSSQQELSQATEIIGQVTVTPTETISSIQATTSSGSSGSLITKRTREDDQADEMFGGQSSLINVNNKKQRSSSENTQTFEQNASTGQAVATIEPFSTANNNDIQVISDDFQTNDGQDSQDVEEEIILDDDTTGGESRDAEYVLASNTNEEYEQQDDDVLVEEDDTQNDEQGDQEDDEDLNLDIQEEETNPNSEGNQEQGENQNDDENENQEDENTGDTFTESNQDTNQNSISPDCSAPQDTQQSQPIQSSNTNTEQTTMASHQPVASQSTRGLFGAATGNKQATFTSTSTTSQQEQRREAPKPIVWNSGTSIQQQQPQQGFQQATSSSNFRIRRNPVPNVGFQSQQQQQQQQPQSQTTQNYFQQEIINQQQQQQQQMSQFRLQGNQNQFSLNNNLNQSNQIQQIRSNSPSNAEIISLNNPQMAQQRTLIRATRAQLTRGGITGQNQRRGGGGGPGGAGRGGRSNFQN